MRNGLGEFVFRIEADPRTGVIDMFAGPQPDGLALFPTRVVALPGELKRRLDNEDRSFVYLRRQVDMQVADRISALKIAGIHSSREFKRHYPEGPTSAHIVGFTNVEDRGQEGIELAAQQRLAGKPGSRKVIKDRKGRIVEDVEAMRPPRDGEEIT